MPRFSLILATYGRAGELDRLVSSLVAHHRRDFELLVMDQNQDDRVVPAVEAAKAGGLAVRHFRLANPSLSGARNRGIAEATGEFVAFPDDDCWYEPNTLSQADDAIRREPALDGLVMRWAEQAAARSAPFDAEPLDEQAWRRFRDGDASSISLVLRRDLLLAVEGFDERFGVGQWFGAGEETDLIFRALARGARIRRCPTAVVHHRFGASPARSIRTEVRAVMSRARGTGALYVKHRLSAWTVVRGLLGPPFQAVLSGRGLRAVLVGMAQSLGRIQGMIQWALRQ